MSRAGLRGPRRTRVYDCNYNAGEKYYRPALDNLDRKYYGKWVQSAGIHPEIPIKVSSVN